MRSAGLEFNPCAESGAASRQINPRGLPWASRLCRGELPGPLASVLGGILVQLIGCTAPQGKSPMVQDPGLHRQAFECLRAAVQYPHNPVVRAEAVEALEVEGSAETRPWIRAALADEHPGVRFAACSALGMLRDSQGEVGIRKCIGDSDPSVRVGALFALHRIGDSTRSSGIPTFLLEGENVTVRRNAALVLGLLGEPSAIPVLARAMNDADVGVRHHALEAMARLGSPEARQELVFLTNSGVGSDEVFAINALAALRDAMYTDTFRYKLERADHLEIKLAAARGLGVLGSDAGFQVSLKALRSNRPNIDDPKDPPEGQVLRVQQLAAAALGAIGRPEAQPALLDVMKKSRDPRLQVSAARAILEIVRRGTD